MDIVSIMWFILYAPFYVIFYLVPGFFWEQPMYLVGFVILFFIAGGIDHWLRYGGGGGSSDHVAATDAPDAQPVSSNINKKPHSQYLTCFPSSQLRVWYVWNWQWSGCLGSRRRRRMNRRHRLFRNPFIAFSMRLTGSRSVLTFCKHASMPHIKPPKYTPRRKTRNVRIVYTHRPRRPDIAHRCST